MADKQQPTADSDSAILTRLVDMYESAEQSTADSRELCERDRDYKNGEQWTEAEIATLKRRKQPVITINRIGPKIDFLLGMETQHRRDPRAFPRTPDDEEGATAATDALRYVMEDNRWDRVRSECFDSFLVEGSCGADVRVKEGRDGYDIEVLPIMWDRMFGDPHSRMRNWSDASFKGQFLWMDLDDAIEKYPDGAEFLESTIASESSMVGQTYDDVPRTRWADPKRKRVRIVEMWSRDKGGWFYTCFTKAGILDRMESPYKDEDGESVDGFVFGSCYIDRDGNRFGVVRNWISLQDEINKRRSKALHLMNVRQTYGNSLSGDKNKLRQELAKPDGHVEMDGGGKFGEDFGVIPTSDMAAAQFQLLQEAKGEIDAVGVNAALSGNEQRNMSGRALIARSEQGLNELGPVFDAFKQWQHDVYRLVWNMIRQFWTDEKWVRVTDDEKNVRFVGLNQPITMGEQLLEEAKAQGAEITPQMEQQAKMDPRMQQVVGVRNNVAEMDVDLVIDDVPASASLQGEQFETLAQIAPQAGSMPPKLFEALIQASSLRNKDAILKSLRGEDEGKSTPKEMQLQQQLQEMQQMMEQAAAKIQELQSNDRETTLKYVAEAAKIENDEFAKITERMKVVAPAMGPAEIQALVLQTVQQALGQDALEGADELEQAVGMGEPMAGEEIQPQQPAPIMAPEMQ